MAYSGSGKISKIGNAYVRLQCFEYDPLLISNLAGSSGVIMNLQPQPQTLLLDLQSLFSYHPS